MAHPFEAVACPYDRWILTDMIPDDRYRRLFAKTAEKGIAVEINGSCFIEHAKTSPEEIRNSSSMRVFRLAKEEGCKFIFGSDAHSVSYYGFYGSMDIIADLLGLTEDDLAPIAR